MSYKRKRKLTKNRRTNRIYDLILHFLALVGAITLLYLAVRGVYGLVAGKKTVQQAPEILEEYLTVNEYSRPGISLPKVKGIVIHYTANPGTGAEANRNYFEGLKDSHDTKASSHYIVGLDGEIIQCIPTSEIAYASNDRNTDTISIECCHPDETGVFDPSTYQSLVHLTAWLCGQYDLTTEDVIRHYDVTGKNCPKYYVEHPEAWEQFLADVDAYIEENGE